MLYRTALSVRAVEVVRTSFEVSSYFARRRLASLDWGFNAGNRLWRKSDRPSTSIRTRWPVLHVGVFPPSGGCTHRPLLDAEPVLCPSTGVNIRRLRHEGLGSIRGQYTWDLWGTEWHKNRLFFEYLRYPLSVWFRRTVIVTRSIMPDNFTMQLAARGSLSAREMPPTRKRNKIIHVICCLFYSTNCCLSQPEMWLLYWNLTVQNYFLIICSILRKTFFFGLSKIVIFLDSRALCVSFSVFVLFWNKLCCFWL
jgi:hypothetical protein